MKPPPCLSLPDAHSWVQSPWRYDGVAVTAHTGIGIPADEHDDVFSRFYRTAAAGERAIQGSGLGLSIVKAIVDQHNGEITLESTPGVGTVIKISLRSASMAHEDVATSPTDAAPDEGGTERDVGLSLARPA